MCIRDSRGGTHHGGVGGDEEHGDETAQGEQGILPQACRLYTSPGLPLSGFFEHFDTKRLLVMGLTETTYVSGMSEERRRESFDRLLSYPVPALIYTRGIDPFPECMDCLLYTSRCV